MDTEQTFFLALKSHRESNGIQLDEISEFTKINPKYLQAIEDGDFYVIPNVYMRLFIRSYCKYIDADYMQALADYELYTTGKIEPKLIDIDEPINKNNQSAVKPNSSTGDDFQVNYKQVATVILTFLAIYLSFKLVEFISNDNPKTNSINSQENNLPESSMEYEQDSVIKSNLELSSLTNADFSINNLVSETTEIIPINSNTAIINLVALEKTALNLSTIQKDGSVFF